MSAWKCATNCAVDSNMYYTKQTCVVTEQPLLPPWANVLLAGVGFLVVGVVLYIAMAKFILGSTTGIFMMNDEVWTSPPRVTLSLPHTYRNLCLKRIIRFVSLGFMQWFKIVRVIQQTTASKISLYEKWNIYFNKSAISKVSFEHC